MKALYKKENRVAFLAMPEDRKIEWMDSIADGRSVIMSDGGCVYEVYFENFVILCSIMTMPLATISFELCDVNTI